MEEVETVRLDDFAREHGITQIDILKVDAQGYDLRVLRGGEGLLKRGSVSTVLCEMNFEPMYLGQDSPGAIYDCLTRFGFRLVCLYDFAMSEGWLASWTDALFVNLNALGIPAGQR